MQMSHNYAICRAAYSVMRENHNAPAVTIIDLGPGVCTGETTDGKVLDENLQGHCCKWAAKVDVLIDWAEKYSDRNKD